MSLRLNNLRVEATNPRQLAQFWIRALNWQLVHGSANAVLIAPTSVRPLPRDCLAIMFWRGSNDRSGTSRLFLDLSPSDSKAEVRRLIELGASPVETDPGDPRWLMMADPEGNEFCVIHPPGQLPRKS